MLVSVVQVLALVATVEGAVTKPRDAISDLQRQTIALLKGVETNSTQLCTVSNAAVRKDW